MEDLTEELRHLNKQVRDLRAELARDYEPRTEQVRRRRRTIAAAATVILLLASGIIANRVTLSSAQHQTEEYVRVLVRECTFNAARLTPAQVRVCENRIPGFSASREAAARRAQDYDALRRWAISRGWKPPPTTAPAR